MTRNLHTTRKRQQIIDVLRLFEHHIKNGITKITNLLDITSDNASRFINKKWIEVHDQSGNTEDTYKTSKELRLKTWMLWSDLCGYSDAYIVVKGDVTLTKKVNRNFIDVRNRFLAFTNNVPITDCISKINSVLIDNAEDLDVVMPMYNLLEYSKNCRKTTGSLWNYCMVFLLIIIMQIP